MIATRKFASQSRSAVAPDLTICAQYRPGDLLGDLVEAERLCRLLMKRDPTDASAPFNLGNMIRAASRTVEAEAALWAPTHANPAFAEAWYNLADLLDDQGRSETAIECLRKALVVAPDHTDAMFNLALLPQRKGSYAEAADHWRRYLAGDRTSEWTARARRSLKFCEIQVKSLTCRPSSPGTPIKRLDSATSHKKNNTQDPSHREADKHKLAQRWAVHQFDCL
jgi:tetratricopeptide (TPR) repeat protein